jgi:hypothetical protein
MEFLDSMVRLAYLLLKKELHDRRELIGETSGSFEVGGDHDAVDNGDGDSDGYRGGLTAVNVSACLVRVIDKMRSAKFPPKAVRK